MLIKELERLIKPIITEKFKYKKEIKGFSWTNTLSYKKEEIVIGYGTFYPNMFQLYVPSVYVYFDNVESILETFVKKYQIKNTWGLPRTIHRSLINVNNVNDDVFETKIHDEASFQFVADEIKKIVEYGALPFFERFQTVEDVYNYAETLNINDYSKFFSGIGTLKMMIMKKLLNKLDYESYSSEMVEEWTKTAKEYPQHFLNIDKVVVELKNTLDIL